ncbi:F0F1 ATP synthase subunit B' [Paracoccus sp. MC1862]|nr:F0F1 ATP synthase subunit B' [Paracoccus sp. MC1854]MBB1498879.1 F0F1 ATP synthase subunit B' [Paracoccus sp. MC1862]
MAQNGQGHLPTDSLAGAAVPGTDTTHAVAHGADAAASAGMPQLDFASFGNQIFWLLVALGLIYLILSRVALPRIGRILGDRQGLMTADLAAAEDFKRKAREAESVYDKALADARAEAQKIVAANKAEIDAELSVAIAKADAEIAARTQESERRISEIRDSAATDARSVARDVAAELVRTFGGNPDGSIDQAVDARIKGAVL